MIDALISGKLYGQPAERTGNGGHRFVTARVRAAAGDGDGEAVIVNVITFTHSVGDALLALQDGDSVSLSGALTPKVWTDKNGQVRPALDLVAHGLLTPYHVKRKREAMEGEQGELAPRQAAPDDSGGFEGHDVPR